MKKLSFLLVLLLIAAPLCDAQKAPISEPIDYKVGARAGVAILPVIPTVGLIFSAFFRALELEDDEHLDYDFRPWTSLEAQYFFNKRISLGIDVGFYTSDYAIRKDETEEIVSEGQYMTLISVLPEFRFNYLPREKFCLYGTAAVGVMLLGGDNIIESAAFNFQLNPIGIEFGKRLYGFAELGAGLCFLGVRGGLGIRF